MYTCTREEEISEETKSFCATGSKTNGIEHTHAEFTGCIRRTVSFSRTHTVRIDPSPPGPERSADTQPQQSNLSPLLTGPSDKKN